MRCRIPSAVVLLTTLAVVGACAGEPARPPAVVAPATPSAAVAPATPSVGASAVGPAPSTTMTGPAVPPADATTPSGAPSIRARTTEPSASVDTGGTTRWRPPDPPPVQLPPRPPGAPGAREVVAAFRAAGLKATNLRDRSVDCGPDGLGLGCSELVVTDQVAVYVFPDEISAAELADRWGRAAYRSRTVILNYPQAPPPNHSHYEKALTTLP
ncbi:hypothetical protein GCM10011608_18400 [Micromonospora sonchi]|uniref:Uncharacterized protein n=1 Tax=Micromonospora sonchi TaxID=1763543 RepID=A0A917TR75_9ACTN|nr:hypothetical protein [Micromonospora sonchi]GGM34241.1 hypothetical protein GCM10011608_18400 [Micromonospora sonchi]